MKNSMRFLSKNKYILFFIVSSLVFFYQFFLFGKMPVPADTVVGMYHPWRDVVWDGFTRGVPFKNPLITDPVRQQYVWRKSAVDQMKKGQLPLWNPYSFSGTPLLANFQTAAFYPLNTLFFFLKFPIAWGILVMLQPLLAGLFLYSYLRHMRVSQIGSILAGLTWSFSGFSIAWLEWNTVVHTGLWLPLILLAKEHLLKRFSLKWAAIMVFAACAQIFAGHLQVLFYALSVSNLYLIVRIFQYSYKRKNWSKTLTLFILRYAPFLFLGIIIFAVTSIQWLPTIQFAQQSAREYDLGSWQKEGWFLPWQHLIQFAAPDFFGNPTTNNYWGVWNYGEFIGYIGIIPLFFALCAIVYGRRKIIFFFGGLAITCLLFALPTLVAKLPFVLNIPFFSTSQPTRLLYVIDLSLAILAGIGFDWWVKEKKLKKTFTILSFILVILGSFWLLVANPKLFGLELNPAFIAVSKKNLILPTVMFIITTFILLLAIRARKNFVSLLARRSLGEGGFHCLIVSLLIFDLFRFGWKFTPFTKAEWLYPETKLISLLKQNIGYNRFMSTDRRIMPANFSVFYRLQDISGYDPLYLARYNQFAAAWTRGKPDVSPAAFNRLVTPHDAESFLTDLLGVKYVLSFQALKSDKLKFIDSEGETFLYENPNAFPKAFFVDSVLKVSSDEEEIRQMFNLKEKLHFIATTQSDIEKFEPGTSSDTILIIGYSENEVVIQTDTQGDRLLVLSEVYYPAWKVTIDNDEKNLHRADFMFRAVNVPSGKHTIRFFTTLL